jgi:hypothetical protein
VLPSLTELSRIAYGTPPPLIILGSGLAYVILRYLLRHWLLVPFLGVLALLFAVAGLSSGRALVVRAWELPHAQVASCLVDAMKSGVLWQQRSVQTVAACRLPRATRS